MAPSDLPTRGLSFPTRNGFTLLEVLVALAVFGLLMAGLTQVARFGIVTWQSQSRAAESRGEQEAVDRVLRDLIARADPGGLDGAPPLFKGTSRELMFTTDLPDPAGVSPPWRADVTLPVDGAKQLSLVWRPRLGRPMREAPPPRSVSLMANVDRLELRYWRSDAGPNGGWQSSWTEDALPRLVRIRIIRTVGGRLVPDIVCAPKRDRWLP